MSLTTRDPEVNPTPLLRWGASGLVPEGTDGGESFHGFSEVGEQRELRRVIQLLQVPVTDDSGWLEGQCAPSLGRGAATAARLGSLVSFSLSLSLAESGMAPSRYCGQQRGSCRVLQQSPRSPGPITRALSWGRRCRFHFTGGHPEYGAAGQRNRKARFDCLNSLFPKNHNRPQGILGKDLNS